jgi:hypothetical protein
MMLGQDPEQLARKILCSLLICSALPVVADLYLTLQTGKHDLYMTLQTGKQCTAHNSLL